MYKFIPPLIVTVLRVVWLSSGEPPGIIFIFISKAKCPLRNMSGIIQHLIDLCTSVDQSIFPTHWCADYSKTYGFPAGGISKSLCPFSSQLRCSLVGSAAKTSFCVRLQYRQLRRLCTITTMMDAIYISEANISKNRVKNANISVLKKALHSYPLVKNLH